VKNLMGRRENEGGNPGEEAAPKRRKKRATLTRFVAIYTTLKLKPSQGGETLAL